jgi:phage nucleotide-binding protein
MKIVKPKDLIRKNVKCLIYGKSGTGKTYFSTGGGSKTLVLDLEGGSTSAQSDVDVIRITSPKEFKEAIEYAKNESKHENLVIDSLTRYSEMLYVAVKNHFTDPKKSMQMWMHFDYILRERNEEIWSINKHVIMIALEELHEAELGTFISFPSVKAKKFKDLLPSYPDLVLYATVQDKKRKIVSAPLDSATTKNRLPNYVPDIIEEDSELFNFYKLVENIKNEKKLTE